MVMHTPLLPTNEFGINIQKFILRKIIYLKVI